MTDTKDSAAGTEKLPASQPRGRQRLIKRYWFSYSMDEMLAAWRKDAAYQRVEAVRNQRRAAELKSSFEFTTAGYYRDLAHHHRMLARELYSKIAELELVCRRERLAAQCERIAREAEKALPPGRDGDFCYANILVVYEGFKASWSEAARDAFEGTFKTIEEAGTALRAWALARPSTIERQVAA